MLWVLNDGNWILLVLCTFEVSDRLFEDSPWFTQNGARFFRLAKIVGLRCLLKWSFLDLFLLYSTFIHPFAYGIKKKIT